VTVHSLTVRGRRVRSTHFPSHVVTQLRYLGVAEKLIRGRNPGRGRSFWNRGANYYEVLERAKELYRRQIVLEHPDKTGGNLPRATLLNDIWAAIENKFKKRGYEIS
jgi:2-polyprenyl-6-methoxyphenol hydroxylase-like FAD-dependent oxidoreductase